MYVHGYTSPFPCFETDGIFMSTDIKSAQAKYRALRAFGWKQPLFHIKYKAWMRLILVILMAKSAYRLGELAVPQPERREAEPERQLGWQCQSELGLPSCQGLLEIDFNQPPSMRPISASLESSCW